MEKEKRRKTKMIQFRVTPENFRMYEEYSKELNLSKTELFEKFLEQLKKKLI